MDFLLQKHDIFENPQHVPLNELSISLKNVKPEKLHHGEPVAAKTEKLPAMHKAFIDERAFPLYQPYFDYETDNADEMVELFCSKGNKFIDGLDYLLSCNYHQFWCYFTQVPSTVKMLKSFLYKFIPKYEMENIGEESLACYSEIHEKVATILIRMLTYKHSQTEFMTEATVLHLLEINHLLTFPVFMNISVLYGETCPSLVAEVARLYFTAERQWNWQIEAKKMLDQVFLAFEMLGGQICGFDDNAVVIPIGVPPKPGHFDPSWYEDLVTFVLDTLIALNAVLSQCEWMKSQALEMGLPYRLTYFYNQVYPSIYKVMEHKRSFPFDWSQTKQRTFNRIANGRRECVNCFHTFITYLTDLIINNQGNHVEQDKDFESYITLITAAMEDDLFIFDYHNSHPIDLQLQLITDFYPELDTMRTNYILECLTTLPRLENIIRKKEAVDRRTNRAEHNLTHPSTAPVQPQQEQEQEHEQVIKELTEDEINEMIQIIADTLPDLGDGFILKCLEYYNFDPVEVLNAFLEENLAPNLCNIPQDMIRVPPEPAPEQPILAYRGKKPQPKDCNEILNDKSELAEVKDFILKKSIVTYDVYDDEYDDRDEYDPLPVRAGKREEEEPNPFQYMENRFDGYNVVSGPSDSSDEEEKAISRPFDKDKSGKQGFRAFCEDPAKLREQREMARKNFGGRAGHHGSGPSRDLVGKPKGQGQDDQVLKNRNKKTTNKSSRANHNRKSGAQWKQSRGMF